MMRKTVLKVMGKAVLLSILLLSMLACREFPPEKKSQELLPSEPLHSDYFQQDQTTAAQKVLQGEPFILQTPFSKNDFGYKIGNALIMLGYTLQNEKSDLRSPFSVALERFKLRNGLSVDTEGNSEQLDAETLREIDEQLAGKELEFRNLAAFFPLRVVTDHGQGISPNYIAGMIVLSLQALPENLVDFSPQNMLNCYVRQCGGSYGSLLINEKTGQQITSLEPGRENQYALYHTMFLGKKNDRVSERIHSPTDFIAFTIHEYGHYLDGSLYSSKPGTTQGIVDTRDFYRLSFQGLEELGNPPFYEQKAYLPLRPGITENDFVTSYAFKESRVRTKEANPVMTYIYVEDFAESFTAYVISGKQFRAAAAQNEILRQKYDWLKQNVFQGIEYDTDLPRMSTEQPFEYVFEGELGKK